VALPICRHGKSHQGNGNPKQNFGWVDQKGKGDHGSLVQKSIRKDGKGKKELEEGPFGS